MKIYHRLYPFDHYCSSLVVGRSHEFAFAHSDILINVPQLCASEAIFHPRDLSQWRYPMWDAFRCSSV